MNARHQDLSLVERKRRASQGVSWIAAALLVMVGVAGLAAALGAQRSLDDLVAHGIPVTGTLLTVGVNSSDRPVVAAQFVTADGTTVVGHSNRFDTGAVDLRHGDALAILYSPEDPTLFQDANWLPPRDLPWLGAAWLLLTFVIAARTVARGGSARRPSGADEAADAA